ncbi:MAG: hypothetical protein HYR56_05325 [Acidobacteria bacterium]|nr:hypothetical protein [Acidobacteriota bacterium]MBI3424534.1 hypothetical protein [Acidobacteriota bacterium]
MSPSPLQILLVKALIALVAGVALATLNVIRKRHGTLWPAERSERLGVISAVVALLLAIPAYLAASRFGQ